MKVSKPTILPQRTYQPTFNAKISPKFVDNIRQFFNQGENRLKNHYKLEEKIKEIETFGYDDYTIGLTKKQFGWGSQYYLFALKDGSETRKAKIIAKRESYRQIINKFMNLTKKDFKTEMIKNNKIEV